MVDEVQDAPATGKKAKKNPTAVDGNAPGGEPFRSEQPMASGKDAVLGNQVEQRNVALGLTPDPGPVLVGEGHDTLDWRNPRKGETLNGVNGGVTVTQRHSTAPDWARQDTTHDVVLGAHVIGLESKASDMYNPAGRGDGELTDFAQQHADKLNTGDPFVPSQELTEGRAA